MPASPLARWTYAPLHAAHVDGKPIDVGRENLAASSRVVSNAKARPDAPLIIVPGYTPLDAKSPVALTETTAARLQTAKRVATETRAIGFLVTGGNVYPAGTPYNEAWGMRKHLIDTLKVSLPVVIDPYARHSTTNLRNAARFMLSRELTHGVIVTDGGQGFYFGAQWVSTFALRCTEELGYVVGELHALTLDFKRTAFTPSHDCTRLGTDPLDP